MWCYRLLMLTCRTSSARALFAWIACLLLVGGGLLRSAHEAEFRHVMCLEHGVIEDVAFGSEEGRPQLLTLFDGRGSSLYASASWDHGEQCSEPSVVTSRPAATAAAFTRAPAIALPATAILVDHIAPRAPPLSYAPKTSPPAA